MSRFRSWVERVALLVLLIGGLGMMMAMFLGTADVVGTQFLGQPVAGALELTESTMVLIVFGALAYAQIRRKHIRVELLYTHMPPRVRAGMDMLAHIAALVFFGLLIWQAIGEAMFSWQIGEATVGLIRFPLWPARWILVIGTALMMLQLALDIVLDLRRIAGKEPVEEIAVLPSIDDLPELSDRDRGAPR